MYETFQKLKEILKEYEDPLVIKQDTDVAYYLNTRVHPTKKNEEGFFGAVHIKKNYVSYYLFPIYCCPSLVNKISPELKKRMQGKSCFNFKKPDDVLFQELEALTNAGFHNFKKHGFI
jgi:hypothetical protein